MGKSQLTQEVGEAMWTAASHPGEVGTVIPYVIPVSTFLDAIKVYSLKLWLKAVLNLFGFYVLKLITNLALEKE